jgi:hypothetical protein
VHRGRDERLDDPGAIEKLECSRLESGRARLLMRCEVSLDDPNADAAPGQFVSREETRWACSDDQNLRAHHVGSLISSYTRVRSSNPPRSRVARGVRGGVGRVREPNGRMLWYPPVEGEI